MCNYRDAQGRICGIEYEAINTRVNQGRQCPICGKVNYPTTVRMQKNFTICNETELRNIICFI